MQKKAGTILVGKDLLQSCSQNKSGEKFVTVSTVNAHFLLEKKAEGGTPQVGATASPPFLIKEELCISRAEEAQGDKEEQGASKDFLHITICVHILHRLHLQEALSVLVFGENFKLIPAPE